LKGGITARDYYNSIVSVLGRAEAQASGAAFLKVLPVEKQQALQAVFEGMKA
jgi:hypothetical protein